MSWSLISPPACLGSRPRSLTRFCCMANLQSLLPSTARLTAILRTTKYSIVGVTSSQETHDTATTINILLHKMHCTGCTCPVLHNGARPFSKSYLNSYGFNDKIVQAFKIAPRARTTCDVNKIKIRLQQGVGFVVHRLATLCRPWLAPAFRLDTLYTRSSDECQLYTLHCTHCGKGILLMQTPLCVL